MAENELPDGFDGYVPISVDPGPSVLIATVVLCALMLGVLPFLVAGHDKLQKIIHNVVLQPSGKKGISNCEGNVSAQSTERSFICCLSKKIS